MQQCQYCGAKWEAENITRMCPFCGENLKEQREELSTIEEALRYVSDIYGDEVFREREKLIGLVADLVPRLEKERRLMKIAIECGAYQAILDSTVQDRNRVVATYISILSDNYSLNEERARQSLIWCVNAIEKLQNEAAVEITMPYDETNQANDQKSNKTNESPSEHGAINIGETRNESSIDEKEGEFIFDQLFLRPPLRSFKDPYRIYKFTVKESGIYRGQFKDGKLNGIGTFDHSLDEFSYIGNWKDGKATGYGKMTYKTGGFYEGEWKENRMNGYGKMINSGGRIYEGEWKDGLEDGKGKLIYNDGKIYEGEFEYGTQSGYGKMIYNDGKIYEGEWRYGYATGYGKMIYSDGKIYEGEWRFNKKNGKGKLIYNDGTTYEGEWKDDKRNGHGIITYKNGATYEGEFVNDHTDETGVFHSSIGNYIRRKIKE